MATVVVGAAVLIAAELGAPCPPGGPLSFGDCRELRVFGIAVISLTAILYVIGLSAVRWWTNGLLARGVADRRAGRDWYLLAAVLGLAAAPLLAFTLVSALR